MRWSPTGERRRSIDRRRFENIEIQMDPRSFSSHRDTQGRRFLGRGCWVAEGNERGKEHVMRSMLNNIPIPVPRVGILSSHSVEIVRGNCQPKWNPSRARPAGNWLAPEVRQPVDSSPFLRFSSGVGAGSMVTEQRKISPVIELAPIHIYLIVTIDRSRSSFISFVTASMKEDMYYGSQWDCSYFIYFIFFAAGMKENV